MPSKSRQQQKFMGIVRSIQKGDAPAGKFSKAAQKAAKSMKKSSVRKYAKTKHDDLPKKVKEERDYKDEYKKFQSSPKMKKYRAELNKYNRKKGTYGNGDGKDASHKGGKIVGFESQSKNRGRAEKSRLKKESINEQEMSIKDAFKDLVKDHGSKKALDILTSVLTGGIGFEDPKKKKKFQQKLLKKMTTEAKLNENPAAIAAAQRMVVQSKSGKVSVNTARQSSYAKKDPSTHKKAKSMWQRIKDKFSKKESVSEKVNPEMKKIYKLLLKYGNSEKDAAKMIKKNYDYVAKTYRNATPRNKAVVLVGLQAMGESVNESKELEQIDKMLKDKIKQIGKKDKQKALKLMKIYKDHWLEFSIKAKQHMNEAFAIQYKKDKRYLTRKELFDKKPLKFKTEDDAKSMLNGLDHKYRTNYKIVKIKEGTCGYGVGGKLGEEPAGPHLMKKKKKLIKSKVEENKDPDIISQLRGVLKKGYSSVKDPVSGKKMKVDTYTASAITKVYDAINTSNKKKFSKLPLLKMQSIAMRFVK
jgi:hypothetical protein